MKKIIFSFLFCFLFSVLIENLYAQHFLVDSLSRYTKVIDNPKNNDELISSYTFFEKQKDLLIKKSDSINLILTLYNIAKVQAKVSDLYGSERSAINALELLDNIKPSQWTKEMRLTLYNHLGIISRLLFRYVNAIEYYEEVLKRTESNINKARAHGNIGVSYLKSGKPHIAISAFNKAMELLGESKDKLLYARLLDNLGSAKSILELPEALDNLKKAYYIRNELNYTGGVITSLLNLSDHYFRKDSIELSSNYISKALQIADKSKNIKYIEATLSQMIDQGNFSRIGDYKRITDSLRIEDIKNNTKYSEAKYNYTKQEKIAKQKELEIDQQKRAKQFYLLLTLLIFSTSFFLFFILKSKHKKEKIKQAYLKETELSKKVHDELANDMSDLMNFVENDIEVADTKKSLLLDNIEDIYLRTRDISTETGSIDLVNFSESINHLLMQHNRQDTKVVINNINTINWQNIADHKKMIVFRCLQELMVNMKKHSKAKLVSVVFKALNNKNEIRYVDDGVGFIKEESKRNGLLNVESRIKGIGGNFNFTTSKGNGFKATLEFNS